MSFRYVSALVLSLMLVGPNSTAAKAPRRQSSIKTIFVYEGVVDSKSASRLLDIVSNSTDKIIGLKLTVAKSADSEERFYSDLSDGTINITAGDPTDSPMEVIINGGVGTTAAGAFFTADGFYLIKSGGSHAAGALSYGAIGVDEASIRLNPRIRIVRRHF